MSYKEGYFDPIPEWESQFDKIIVNDDTLKDEDGTSKLLSYITPRRVDQMHFRTNHYVTIEATDIIEGFSLRGAIGGQTDKSMIEEMMVHVKHKGRTILQYCPITQTLVIPDIYHQINEFTEMFRELCMELMDNLEDYLIESESSSVVVLDGKTYTLREVDNVPNGLGSIGKTLSNIRESYKEAIERATSDLEVGVPLDEREIKVLHNAGITLYSQDDGMLIAYKDVKFIVSMATEGGWAVELPEDWKVKDSGTLRVEFQPQDRSKQEIKHVFAGASLDTPHIHRDGGDSDSFHSLCTGSVTRDINGFDTVNKIIDFVEAVEESLETLNLGSPYSSLEGYLNYKRNSEYRDFIEEERT